MSVAADSVGFVLVFSLFAVAALVLVVLTVRFVVRQGRQQRNRWLADQGRDGRAGLDDLTEDGPDEPEESPEITALVLAGGGSKGAVQIGMLQVLAEHGFVPDRIYGASVGAINGVGFAADPTREGVERMTGIWTQLRREDIYPQGRLHGPWLYFQHRDAVFANTGLRAIVEEGFPFERLEDAVIPVEVVATSLRDGGEHWFTYGPAADAVLASAAMPAIFPPVEIDGERYVDGGVVDNVPIQRAIDAGATRLVVLLCAPPVFEPPVTRRPVESMVNALFIAIHARFVRDMTRVPDDVEVILCVGPEGSTRDFDDFTATEHLIAQGRAEASEVVRRYGLGTIAYPAPVPPTVDTDRASDHLPENRREGDRRSADRRAGVVNGVAPPPTDKTGKTVSLSDPALDATADSIPGPEPDRTRDQDPAPVPSLGADPWTQPEPGT